ncbi:MAG: SDR family oxidoreductase [Firmicutes bacterium]|nr:SDR family oxidoreductase [Bacillota bacterium]
MHIKELFDLSGRVAIVTGGSVGLGQQMGIALAEAGANVVLAARKVERCEAAADKIKKELGVKAIPVRCDVSKWEDVENLVATTLKEFGKIDILVNNAGATWGAPAVDYPLKGWQKVIDVNINGTWFCCQQVGRVMIDQKRGKIINIASLAAFVGAEPEAMDAVAYQTSKGGVVALTRDLAVKWARYNINVNAIAPGWFPTDMTDFTLQKSGEILLRYIPMRRFGQDDELKGAVVYLASDASSYVTGHTLCVDGGYVIV